MPKKITVDFTQEKPIVCNGDYAGEIDEINAVQLEIIPEQAMAEDESIVSYAVYFAVGENIQSTRTFAKTEPILFSLWSDLTANETIEFQLIASNNGGSVIMKSPVMRLVFGESIEGEVVGADDKHDSLISQIADLEDKKHWHTNKAVLDKLSESETGKLEYDGSIIGGSDTVIYTLGYDEETDRTVVTDCTHTFAEVLELLNEGKLTANILYDNLLVPATAFTYDDDISIEAVLDMGTEKLAIAVIHSETAISVSIADIQNGGVDFEVTFNNTSPYIPYTIRTDIRFNTAESIIDNSLTVTAKIKGTSPLAGQTLYCKSIKKNTADFRFIFTGKGTDGVDYVAEIKLDEDDYTYITVTDTAEKIIYTCNFTGGLVWLGSCNVDLAEAKTRLADGETAIIKDVGTGEIYVPSVTKIGEHINLTAVNYDNGIVKVAVIHNSGTVCTCGKTVTAIPTKTSDLTNDSNFVNQTALNTEATTRASADSGLQEQINNLKARGRFLSLWNATTGLAMSEPTVNPYEYKTGDYFIVEVVGTTNYKPSGTQYDKDSPSTAVETSALAQGDSYFFDGSTWILQKNTQATVSFSNLAGSPFDNSNLATALNGKVDKVDDKGLSTNDYTTAEKSKLAGLENYDDTELRGLINGKQDTLVSGQNVKTVNNQSLLGSGNITISGLTVYTPEDFEGLEDYEALCDFLRDVVIEINKGNAVFNYNNSYYRTATLNFSYAATFFSTDYVDYNDNTDTLETYEIGCVKAYIPINETTVEWDNTPSPINLADAGGIRYDENATYKNYTTGKKLQNLTAEDERLESVKANKTSLDFANKRIDYIYNLTQGQTWDVESDNTNKYQKSVPKGSAYAAINALGGCSVFYTQLVAPNSTEVETISGRSYYTYIDGTEEIITSDGTAIAISDPAVDKVMDLSVLGVDVSTVAEINEMFPNLKTAEYEKGRIVSSVVNKVNSFGKNLYNVNGWIDSGAKYGFTYKYIFEFDVKAGHKYSIWIDPNACTPKVYTYASAIVNGANVGLEDVSSATNSYIYITSFGIFNPKIFTVNTDCKVFLHSQLGQNGYTQDEIATRLPKVLIEEIASSETTHSNYTKFVNKNFDISETVLEKCSEYGLSTFYKGNIIDASEKKYTKSVKKIRMDSLNWILDSGAYSATVADIETTQFDVKFVTCNYPCENNKTYSDKQCAIFNNRILIKDSDFNTVADFVAMLTETNAELVYPLETPIEVDLSDVLPDDNLLETAEGKLTFKSDNDSDFHLPVYSRVDFAVNLQEATTL